MANSQQQQSLASNGALIAAATNPSLSFWGATTYKWIGPDITHTAGVTSMAISPNFNLAMRGGRTITVDSLCNVLPPLYLDNVSASNIRCTRWMVSTFLTAACFLFSFWPRVYCGSYTRLGLRAMEKRMRDRLRAPRGTPLSRLAYTRLPIDCLICNYLWALALHQRTVFTDVVMTFELSTGKVMNSWQQ